MSAPPLTGAPSAVLTPARAQRVFRAVLDALARPGRPVRLPAELAPVALDTGTRAARPPDIPAALLPVLALADLDTGVCVLADEPARTRWADLVTLASSAPGVALSRARLVTALRPAQPDELRALPRGRAPAPEEGALVTLTAPRTGGTPRWWLSGPGVRGRLGAALPGLSPELVAARCEAVAGFPTGIDLLLVDPDGWLIGLPRTTTIEGAR